MSLEKRENPIDGATIRMGGRDFVVPALAWGELERLETIIGVVGTAPVLVGAGPPPAQYRNAVAELVLAALKRNYPGATLEDVGELLDLNNARPVVLAVLGQAGFEPRKAGAPGEA